MRKGMLFAVLCLLAIAAPVAAQAADCPTLAQQAMTAFGQNCLNIEADTACYGHAQVQATPIDSTTATAFTLPAERISLSSLQSLHTFAPDLTAGQWGIALLNLQTNANLLLLGDVSLDLPQDSQPAASDLFFQAGFAVSPCGETPSTLAVQTAQATDLTINQSSLRVNGLLSLRWESENRLTATVYSGQVDVLNGATALAGQTLAGVMDNNGNILFWSAARAAKADELGIADVVARTLSSAQIITETTPPPAVQAVTAVECQSVTHIVEPGENLFRIALRYNTTTDAIARANGLSNINVIQVGQQLVIPCGVDTGTSSVAPVNNGSPPPDPSTTTNPDPSTAQTPPDLSNCTFVAPTGPVNVPFNSDQIVSVVCQNP